jgi:hypothetical protein
MEYSEISSLDLKLMGRSENFMGYLLHFHFCLRSGARNMSPSTRRNPNLVVPENEMDILYV